MRVLQLHCSDFNYQITKETPVAEQPGLPKDGAFNNVLVCFICYEKIDENRHNEILKSFEENVIIDTQRIGCKNILLYPYPHLSKKLGSARKAKIFLEELREKLGEEGLIVHKSPFGWYKAFGLYCKGHPLAEAYREY